MAQRARWLSFVWVYLVVGCGDQGTQPKCVADCWTVKAPMSTVRWIIGVGALDGLLYTVWGPMDRADVTMVAAYDPNTNRWITKGPKPYSPPSGLAVVNGFMYAISSGGFDAYDPATDAWTARQPPNALSQRFGLSLGAVNGIIYAIGGSDYFGRVTGEVDAYDPVSNTWTIKAAMPTPRSGVAIGVVNGVLYAVGGSGDGLTNPLPIVEAYDPISDTWATKTSLPTTLSGFDVGVVNGVVYAVGGAVFPYDCTYTCIVNTVEAYDPATNTWTTKAPMLTGRRDLRVGVLNGVLYAIGGLATIPGFPSGTNEAYRP